MDRKTTDLENFVHRTLSEKVRRMDAQQRKWRTLAATIAECGMHGFRSVSVIEIAKRARVSTASIYRDFDTREKLLEEATLLAAKYVQAELNVELAYTDIRLRLIGLLIQQCQIFQHPHASWLYRAYVSGEFTEDSAVANVVRDLREKSRDVWHNELAQFEEIVGAKIQNKEEAIDFLLGAVHRRTILSMLLFGDDDAASPDLETAATSAVDWLIGTQLQAEGVVAE